MNNPPANSSYACDTLPAARLADPAEPSRSPSPPPTSTTFDIPALAAEDVPDKWDERPLDLNVEDDKEQDAHEHLGGVHAQTQPPARKLCIRHQRMADEGTNLKLQQALDALPVEERESINSIWSNFSSSAHPRRELILRGLLTMCCFSQLSLLTDQLGQLIRIDPCAIFPREVALKVLGYLDATSLCRAAQVSRRWKSLADDDILWRGICEQHIGTKCKKCGWGLPVLERRRTMHIQSASPSPGPALLPTVPTASKRKLEDAIAGPIPVKRQRSDHLHAHEESSSSSLPLAPQPLSPFSSSSSTSHTLNAMEIPLPSPSPSPSHTVTRPWKDVYSERLKIERNWRRGRCSFRILKGHTDGVMCLQFSETLAHPAFPILITGSYDRTARVWNLETGEEMRCLKGHTRAVRALQFDAVKLVTGSMDHTLRVWNWRTGTCIRTLEGHTAGVICLNFDSHVLASGSVDTTVKVWNFRTGECFTLRGHRDWVNAVQLWDARPPQDGRAIGAGKMLFSASDDGSIRLWDLAQRTCVKQFMGHMGQVQSLRLILPDGLHVPDAPPPSEHPGFNAIEAARQGQASEARDAEGEGEMPHRSQPLLVSGSLDNTIKVWDVETGKTLRTLFGHIEGVWAVASDKMRLVSGSHDRTIKVWSRDDGRCVATLAGHTGAVTCLALGEDQIVSGSDDGDVRIWSFLDDGLS
ncbi:WD40 repeat-like protein [Auriscalpium vulgare]|uniref:WD40 repeat-like protein n=1 Tax=Auriscalpium vulgare TaxID=40419 RepID=A0ACB8S0K9_9AGAM|nr:WD40 repeat-like protein [Auriscalpium vulgare]